MHLFFNNFRNIIMDVRISYIFQNESINTEKHICRHLTENRKHLQFNKRLEYKQQLQNANN